MSSDQPAARPRGRLFVVSAPSGAGKTTLVERLVERVPNLVMSRSYTSRAARPGERHGVDYHFVSRGDFEAMVGRREFLEWTDNFGDLYGTRALDTQRLLDDGSDVVLVIDVKGARQVRQSGMPATTVFVLPPSAAELEARLRGRSRDPEPAILRRLAVAREEVASVSEYDFVVVNDELEGTVERLLAIVLAERARRDRMQAQAAAIVATFTPPRIA